MDIDFLYQGEFDKKEPNKKPSKKWLSWIFPKLGIPAKNQLKKFPLLVSRKERYLFNGLVIVIIASLIYIPVGFYFNITKPIPALGGKYQEGVIGEPRYINPIISQISDPDKDLASIIYSGLTKIDKDGNIVPDLAKNYEVSEDGLNFTFFLRENVKWHDETPMTADDVVFTILTIQNQEYSSPQRPNWQGVEVKKLNDLTIQFTLKNKFAQFLSNTTMGILPKHLWQDIKPINFALSDLNLKPIGTGPFKFHKLKKDSIGRIKSYELIYNEDYYNERPFIDKIIFKFFGSEDEMIIAYNNHKVDGISFISSHNLPKLKSKQRLNIRRIKLPRYFAVFFNKNKSRPLADKNVRIALAHGLNKDALIKEVLSNEAVRIDSPVLPSIFNFNKDIKKYDYNPDFANKILDESGWKDDDINGVREKGSDNDNDDNNDRLEIKLVTSNWPEFVRVANFLKEQWNQLGIKTNLIMASIPELQSIYIKERDYDMLLFGEILNIEPDPFSFWHSSQRKDPGLNLALYNNENADKILEEARQILDKEERAEKYDDFQRLVIEDIPALFLYSSYYIYPIHEKVKGLEASLIGAPSDRFSNIEDWYVKTKRVRK